MTRAIGYRLDRLEADAARAGTVEAALRAMSDDDLKVTIAFIRARLAELPKSPSEETAPDVVLTGAQLAEIAERARAWQGRQLSQIEATA